MTSISNITRSPGDPRILHSGPSSLGVADRAARALGWFSLGLGTVELLAPRLLTRALGMENRETLVRVFGAREIASGVLTLSVDKELGLWSRVVGDGLDIATVLAAASHPVNPRRGNALTVLLVLAAITAIDVASAQAVVARHARKPSGALRRTPDRSGFPQGLAYAREIGRQAARAARVDTLRAVAG